ncbi:hypothetical protein [Streptomyces sioyaensis]|uniref:hypothetical protein n=1 Tax=Streptomyces sioyaensis TaxID=67364 RepID=UPI003F541100
MNLHRSAADTSRSGVGSSCHASIRVLTRRGAGQCSVFHHGVQAGSRAVKSSKPSGTSSFGREGRLPGRGWRA